MHPTRELTYRRILAFWLPLAATWLMMALEGPFLAAVIARLADPTENLAAYGVTYSFALIVEAPIIMMLSASTALVRDRSSFVTLRNFTFALNGILTSVMLLLLFTPAFQTLTLDWMELPEPVARLTRIGLLILLPWPGAIGYRRFYQGLLIRNNLTRRVAYGTVIRLIAMATTALALYAGLALPGALVGASALAAGVTAEALATRWMARGTVRRLIESPSDGPAADRLTVGRIIDFYLPLALTSVLSLAVHPMVAFFLGQSRQALDSLAVFPVVNSLSFVFRSLGLSYQEVTIALLAESSRNVRRVGSFALLLAAFSSSALALIAFTPLSFLFFREISGLTRELTEFAQLPLRILTPLPALTVFLSFQRAVLVHGRTTRPVTAATFIEVTAILGVLFLTIAQLDLVGAVAATTAILVGRLGSNLFLFAPSVRILRREKARVQSRAI